MKAVSELYSPVSGEVVEVNAALKDKPEAVNADPHGSWMIVLKLTEPRRSRRAARRHPVSRSREIARTMLFDPEQFQSRHIGPDDTERDAMLKVVGASSLDALIDEAVPARIRLKKPLNLPAGVPEFQYLRDLRGTAARNQVFRSYIGLGYYDCVTPSVILRNVLENPGWYTPYTPVSGRDRARPPRGAPQFSDDGERADGDGDRERVAAGRSDGGRRGDDDAAPGAGQADRRRGRAAQFFVADTCFPQTLDVLRARAEPLGIELIVGDFKTAAFSDRVFGALVQTPDEAGCVHDLGAFIAKARRRACWSPSGRTC